MTRMTDAELARDFFNTYIADTGGKAHDGKPVPPYEVIAERTPHVAKAWEAVARRARDLLQPSISIVGPAALAPADGFVAPPGNPGARVVRTGG